MENLLEASGVVVSRASGEVFIREERVGRRLSWGFQEAKEIITHVRLSILFLSSAP
jgi:hypothetical protein